MNNNNATSGGGDGGGGGDNENKIHGKDKKQTRKLSTEDLFSRLMGKPRKSPTEKSNSEAAAAAIGATTASNGLKSKPKSSLSKFAKKGGKNRLIRSMQNLFSYDRSRSRSRSNSIDKSDESLNKYKSGESKSKSGGTGTGTGTRKSKLNKLTHQRHAAFVLFHFI
jgi:hypothetical protein